MAPTVDANALKSFKEALSSTAAVVTPDSENYTESLERWSLTAERPAGLIVFPTTVEDVSRAVLFAQTHNLELAVKGGGHSTSGSSSTDGGLCIDLGKMREVSVDAENQTVTAQGGALWSDVDAEAAKFSLACVGGTVNHTGIGGLTLGGGYGHLTGEQGLTIDNLLSVDYVLADGSFVTASATENQDLFWAARGAGTSFGVATSFTYRGHKQEHDAWGGLAMFPKTDLEKIITFANHALSLGTGKHSMALAYGAPPPTNTPTVMALLVFNGPSAAAEEFYAPLLTLPSIILNTTQPMPFPQLNSLLNDAVGFGIRRIMKGAALPAPISVTQAESFFSDFEDFVRDVPDAANGTLVLLDYMLYEKILEVKQTDTAFSNRGAFNNVTFAPGWTKKEFDATCRQWSGKMARKAKEMFVQWQQQEGTKLDDITKQSVGEYSNHDGLNASGEALFGVNYPRLKELKKRYDPTNVFCKGPNLLA